MKAIGLLIIASCFTQLLAVDKTTNQAFLGTNNEVDLETTRTLNESDITGPSFSCRREDVPGELPIVPPSMRF